MNKSKLCLLDALYLTTGNMGYNMLKHNIENSPYKDLDNSCDNGLNEMEM